MKSRRILFLMTALSAATFNMSTGVAKAQPPAAPATSTAPAETTASPAPTPTPLAETAPLVKINGEELTVEQFAALLVLRPERSERINPTNDTAYLRGERLEKFATNVGAYDVLAKQAKDKGVELEERENKNLEDVMKGWNQYLLTKLVLNDKTGKPTEEDLNKLYDELKENEFRIKESIKLRQIFVSTYEDHTVVAGESLESIARAIAGDESVANLILDDQSKRPRAERKELAKTDENTSQTATLDPRALQVGEKLKVPVRGEKEKKAKDKIDQAYAKLKAGESFESVAKEFSETENPGQLYELGPEMSERPIMPELRNVFMSLDDKKFSEPIRTRHGFQIVFRDSYTAPGFAARKDSDERLTNTWSAKKRTELIDQFFLGQLKNTDITKINEDEIAKAREAAPDDKAPLLKIGEKEILLTSLSESAQAAVKAGKEISPEALIEAIKKEQPVQQAVVEAYIKNQKFDEMPMTVFVKEKEIATLLASKYLDKESDEKSNVSDEAVSKWYEENKDKLKEPATFELYRIMVDTMKADDLKAALSGIQNVEDFKAKADELNPKDGPLKAMPGGALGTVTVDRLSEDDLELIKKVTPPAFTDVASANNQQKVYWVQSAKEEKIPSLEEKKADIETMLKKQNKNTAIEDMMTEAKKEVKVEALAK